MVKKISKLRSKIAKIAKFGHSDRWCCTFDPSLEAGYGAHPPLFLTSAIQMIFGMPLICIIMRATSENGARMTRFPCVRLSTVSVMRKVPIVSG